MTTACTNCNAPLPEGANFCPKCGAFASAKDGTAPSRGMPKWVIGLLIAAAVLFISIPVLGIVAAIAIPNFIHAKAESMTVADENNLKQIAMALEQYAVDHDGKYPQNLPQLVPAYIAKLPVVPGGDGTGAYDYHHPASMAADGKYEIWDDGSMDSTTLGNLPQGVGGKRCGTECKYVVYADGVGIIGVSGQQ